MDGTILKKDEVADAMFAEEILGKTFVIITEPVKDRVYQFKEEGSITRGEVI